MSQLKVTKGTTKMTEDVIPNMRKGYIGTRGVQLMKVWKPQDPPLTAFDTNNPITNKLEPIDKVLSKRYGTKDQGFWNSICHTVDHTKLTKLMNIHISRKF